MVHQQRMWHAKEDSTKQVGQPRLVHSTSAAVFLNSTSACFIVNVRVSALTCPEDWCVFHSSSWHAALAHPGRGSRGAAGRGCPVVSAPPGWMPFPAGWRKSGYTTLWSLKEFALGEVYKPNKKSDNPDHSDSCVSHHSMRLVMTHNCRAQTQWSFWCFL